MARTSFLNPESVDAAGLVGVGGDLSPARLIEAYSRGIFPFYDEDLPLLWWSPDPRAIIEIDTFHVPRRLARTLRSGRFDVTFSRAFSRVMACCADRPETGTWITPEMMTGYCELHEMGHAHSVEVWREGGLVGGVYGVAIGGLFSGESMFSRTRDASKVALAHLMARLRERGFQLFDIQYLNPHTQSLGGKEIRRKQYLKRLRQALQVRTSLP